MHKNRNQVGPHAASICMSRDSDEQKKPRRRSLDNLLGNRIARDERTPEEIVRENLRQMIIKYQDWDAYLLTDPDYVTFISNWSCHWWYSYSPCTNHRERHFLQSLDGHFQCALHYAVRHNNLRFCQFLIEEKNCDVNVQGINGESVLHMYASRYPWSKIDETDPGEQILRLLFTVKSKVKIDALDDELRTPLHHAVKHNNYSYVKWLIDHGADVTKTSRFCETPLHLACSLPLDSDCLRMISNLIDAVDPSVKNVVISSKTEHQMQRRYVNMCDADGKTALCRAAENNHTQTVTLLLPYADSAQWETTLVSAVKSGNRTILTTILEVYSGHSFLNIPLLHLACKLNYGRQILAEDSLIKDEDQIIPLLVEDFHINTISNYNKEGYTPILLAAHFGYVNCFKYLFSTAANAELQLQERTRDRHQNIFHICAEQAHQTNHHFGHLPICESILQNTKYKYITESLLIEHDNKGYIPLHIACQKSNLHLCKLLISYMSENAYLFIRDLKQCTALHICAQVGNAALVKILLLDTVNKQIANKALNDTRDIDGKTALHLACTVGNLDIMKCFVEEFDACLTTHTDNRETLIASACANGHLNVVNYLLETTDADATIRNSKGLNALDIAIINGQREIVQRLLECDNWRRLLENAYYENDGNVSTPMRELILLMPSVAYEIIDRKLTRVKGNNDMNDHQVVYDYTFFEDQYHICDWMYGDDRKSKNRVKDAYTSSSYILVRNHPLLLVAQSEQIKLMEHDYCTQLCIEKFQRFGLGFFTFICLTYLLFVTLYTVIALDSKHPFYYYKLYNRSINGTLVWDHGFDVSICRDVAIYLLKLNNSDYHKTSLYKLALPSLYLLLLIFFLKNVCIILFSFPRIFRKLAVYSECLALILCLTFILDWNSWQKPLKLRCPIQWQLGSVGVLLTWIGILGYMRYVPWMNCGLYVVMMQVIFYKFLKCLPLLLTLICGFGFTFCMLLQYESVYGTTIQALLRTAISLNDIGYESHLYSSSSNGIMLYPVVYFVIIAGEITLTIIITNLLIGLAVGEIPTLKTEALLTRSIIFYQLLFDYEFLHMQLKRFGRFLLKGLRYCRCSHCRCSSHCAIHTRDYMTVNRHQHSKLFLSRWMKRIEGCLVEKQVQSAVIHQKEKMKRSATFDKDQDE